MKSSDWHLSEAAHVLQQLGSDVSNGLSGAEAARRLKQYGPNELQAGHRISAWAIFSDSSKTC